MSYWFLENLGFMYYINLGVFNFMNDIVNCEDGDFEKEIIKTILRWLFVKYM